MCALFRVNRFTFQMTPVIIKHYMVTWGDLTFSQLSYALCKKEGKSIQIQIHCRCVVHTLSGLFSNLLPILLCQHRARRSFWTCLKTNTGAWRLVALHLMSHLFFHSLKNETWCTWNYKYTLGVVNVCPGAVHVLVCMHSCTCVCRRVNRSMWST